MCAVAICRATSDDDQVAAELHARRRGRIGHHRVERRGVRIAPQVVVMREIGDRRGRAASFEVCRRRDEQDVRRRDLPGDQRRRFQSGRRRAHRDVVAFVDQLDDAVGQRHLDRYARIAIRVIGHGLHHVPQPERGQRRHTQAALRHDARGADRLPRLVEFGQRLHQALVIFAPRLGGRDAARRAMQQPRTELVLEMHHVLARHRGRHLHALRRADEAAHFDDVAKHIHADEGIHRTSSQLK